MLMVTASTSFDSVPQGTAGSNMMSCVKDMSIDQFRENKYNVTLIMTVTV